MRAILLPCTNQYPEVGMWMKSYEKIQQETDQLVVRFGMPHGEALKEMVIDTDAEYLLFCEMDGIILQSHSVDYYFHLLESEQYDVIGSPRMSCGPEIARIAKERFHLNYEGLGDKGPHFWPCFFFVKRSFLMKTDLDFSNHAWKDGDMLLGQTLHGADASDTMGWMSLQLRSLGARILEIPQYHTHPNDLEDYQEKRGLFESPIPWIHLGSISGDLFVPQNDMERRELTKRLVWKELCGITVDTSLVNI